MSLHCVKHKKIICVSGFFCYPYLRTEITVMKIFKEYKKISYTLDIIINAKGNLLVRKTVSKESKLDFKLITKVFDESKKEKCTALSSKNNNGIGCQGNTNCSCA